MQDVEGIRVSCVRGANQAPYLIYTGQSGLTRAAYRYFSARGCLPRPRIKTSRSLPTAPRPQRPLSNSSVVMVVIRVVSHESSLRDKAPVSRLAMIASSVHVMGDRSSS